MKRDAKIDAILTEIQKEFLAEFGEELTLDEIALCVDAQFAFGKVCMEKGEGVRFTHIGKIVTHESKRAKRTLERENKDIIRGELDKTITTGSGIQGILKLKELSAHP